MAKPRKLWRFLKPSTKTRYRRAGIHPNTYNAGKVSTEQRKAARGHARTPETPAQAYRHPEEFADYLQRHPAPPVQQVQPQHVQYVPVGQIHSDEVKQRLAERIQQAFGDRFKFRGVLDPDFPPLDYPPAPDDDGILETLELGDDELEDLARQAHEGNQPEYWFLWYH